MSMLPNLDVLIETLIKNDLEVQSPWSNQGLISLIKITVHQKLYIFGAFKLVSFLELERPWALSKEQSEHSACFNVPKNKIK